MKPFIHDDFLLQTPVARALYHGYAAQMPIIDYHCHLPPAEVAEDTRWANMTRVWLGGDHYKWRVMRSNGVDERFITGDAPDREKFQRFAETMPYLLRNPMFDWSHLELARYFGCFDLLSPDTADTIWKRTGEQLAQPEFSARNLMLRSNVRLVCTTDDPCDTLAHHAAVKASGFGVQMLPTWRPDKALAIDRPAFWNAWLDRLADASGMAVQSWDDLLDALKKRHDHFARNGCRLSDYGVERVYAEPYTEAEIRDIFKRIREQSCHSVTSRFDLSSNNSNELNSIHEQSCHSVTSRFDLSSNHANQTNELNSTREQSCHSATSQEDICKFRSAILFECMRMDAEADWSVQIHYGPMRNNNTKMFRLLGPDAGFDSMGDWHTAQPMSRLFDRLEQADALPRVVIYTLNPRDNEMVAAMLGNFQRGPEPGRMQFGSGWWFNDQRDGMLRQIEALSQLGLLSRFVGMLTDSRSFLSYTRHEYFRRILCNLLGADITEGRIPHDIAWTGEVVKDICYRNAVRYFGFELRDGHSGAVSDSERK